MSNSDLNNDAWMIIFEKYEVLKYIALDGFFTIQAKEIKKFREPRLMAKFDHHVNLPSIFHENNLAILPISRGEYCISNFQCYKEFETIDNKVQQVSLPDYIQSINPLSISSETVAINCAFISGMLSHFTGDESILPTVSGRMGSGSFKFNILNSILKNYMELNVNNAQIEIDAAFESVNYLYCLEAKCDISDDFIIRQLYYPLRTLQTKIYKNIKMLYLVYSNGIFDLYEYLFEDIMSYNSIKIRKHSRYSVEDTRIEISEIERVLNSVSIIDDPEIPFPQADKFERVINICEILSRESLNREDITVMYEFDARQTNYYTDAARYLGLIEKVYIDRKPSYRLSDTGAHILGMPYKARQLEFCQKILSHRIFNTILKICFEKGVLPERQVIVDHMKASKLYNVEGESTYYRRSSTITSWLNWIMKLC
ncbi:MAG: transcriptional regulator [Bacteroidales bacterium]|jgi:hypothetical protein|nr:transcriptional regulator [Bacteroidales bacterium]